MKIITFSGCEEVCFVVPTADLTDWKFAEFYKGAISQSMCVPTIVAVESKGQGFNFSKSVNAGITYILKTYPKNKYVCISNDDLSLPHNFISEMLKCMNSQQKVGYVTPIFKRNCTYVNGQVIMPDYTSVLAFTFLYSFLYQLKWFIFPLIIHGRNVVQRILKEKSTKSTKVSINGMVNSQPISFISRSELEKIGLFDENYHNGCEDFDFTIRTYLLGLRVLVNNNVVVYDIGSGTIGKGGFNALYIPKGNDNGIQSSKNWSYLIHKFGRKQYKKFLKLSKLNTFYYQ